MLALLIPGLLMGGSSEVSATGWTGEWVYPTGIFDLSFPSSVELVFPPHLVEWRV